MSLKSDDLHNSRPESDCGKSTQGGVKSSFFIMIEHCDSFYPAGKRIALWYRCRPHCKKAELPSRGHCNRETPYMLKLKGTASENQKSMVLVVCLLVMSVMCIGLIWQAQIIENQREDIKWLQSLKFGG
jgi:hypothetical protein